MTLTLADQKYDELEELFTTSLCQSWSSQKRRPAKQWVPRIWQPPDQLHLNTSTASVPKFQNLELKCLYWALQEQAKQSGPPDIIYHNMLCYLLYGLGVSYLVLTICVFPSQVFCPKAMGKSWKNQKDARLQRIAGKMEVLGTWLWHSKVLDLESQHSQLYANIVKVAADMLVKFLERGNDVDKITAYGLLKSHQTG